MLLSYRVKNFCSFKDDAEFDLIAPRNKVKKRYPNNYIKTNVEYDILKTAVIIGENAGGKTNFIKSLHFLKEMFENNKSKQSFRNLININNLQSSSSEQNDTKQEFDLSIIVRNETIYHYFLAIDEFSIVEERLAYKKKKSEAEKLIIHLTRKNFAVNEDDNSLALSFDIVLDKQNKAVNNYFDSTSFALGDIGLFVAKLAILGESHAKEFVDWINNDLFVEGKSFNYYIYKNMLNEEDDLRIIHDKRFLDILRMVDYSIINLEIDDEKPFRDSKIIRKMQNGKEFSREVRMDSTGVGEFFAWAVQLFRVVYEDKVIFADEMDRVINPILAERMIAFINGKTHRGQFIFSTHNALHLDLKNYMKEQIYFVTKTKNDLNSELYSLSDFPEVRYETTKIYEFYMKGILGGTAFE